MKISSLFSVLLSVAFLGPYALAEIKSLDVSAPSNQNEASIESTTAPKKKMPAPSYSFLENRRVEEGGHDDHDHDDHDHDDHDDDKKKPSGEVIGFTLLVNLITFSGVVFLVSPSIRSGLRHKVVNSMSPKADEEMHAHAQDPEKNFHEDDSNDDSSGHSKWLDLFVPAFAAGALIATVLFLILPEGLVHINDSFSDEGHEDHRRFLEGDGDEHEDHDEHAGEIVPDAVWRFGTSVMGGFLLPFLFACCLPNVKHDEIESSDKKNEIDWTLAFSVLLGDFFHNFSDGVFMGVAFMLCDKKTAYTIFAVTLYHEIAQEVADFFLLTKHAGLTIVKALIFNFVSGLSIVLGGITVLLMEVTDLGIGVILSVSSGVYLYIACTECFSRVNTIVDSNRDRLFALIAFVVGAVPIGLALIEHSHCDVHHEDH